MGLVHCAWAQGLADDCLELQALVRPVQQLTREGTAVARDYLDVACLLVSWVGCWHAGAAGACTVLTHWCSLGGGLWQVEKNAWASTLNPLPRLDLYWVAL
jgi:hypothetical protein